MPNRLAASTSPYLQQHRDNPVDWWEWSPEAFAEAARRDVAGGTIESLAPCMISIGSDLYLSAVPSAIRRVTSTPTWSEGMA